MPLNPSSSLAQLLNAPIRAGRVVWLGIRPGRREELVELQAVDFDVTQGVLGEATAHEAYNAKLHHEGGEGGAKSARTDAFTPLTR